MTEEEQRRYTSKNRSISRQLPSASDNDAPRAQSVKVGDQRVDNARVTRTKTLEVIENEYGQNFLPKVEKLKVGEYQNNMGLSSNRSGVLE